jgi:hypothetical protein
MNSQKQLTIREQIIRSLETRPMTARDLSKALHISEKDALPLTMGATILYWQSAQRSAT